VRVRAWVRHCRLLVILGCAVLAVALALSRYLGDLPTMALLFLAAGITLSSLLASLVWLLVRPSRVKLGFLLPALLALVVTIPLLPIAGSLAWPLYLWPRQQQLDVFVQDLLTYGQIHQMSDGLRYHKSLNGKHFDASHRVVESPAFPPLVPVLETEEVDPVQYERFRSQLIRLGFIEVQVTHSYVALLYDGFLDNLHGILWVRPGSAPPSEREKVFDTDLVSLRELGNGWFAFGTT
jgi:hypothetical protein